ncbi:MAG: hypothetical protein E6Q39_01450 [Crocinitomicaceae bacterium]|nr:MAG: hypothetical protein E6Q39_01450 [Crocinitomicaceae bacterium]
MESVTLSDSLNAGPLALLLQGVLADTAKRHGNRLPGLNSRLGLVASESREEVTLVFHDDGCLILPGLVEPDLTLQAESVLLPRLQTIPVVLGLPLFASPAGLDLLRSFVRHPLKVSGLGLLFKNPARVARALLDVARLVSLLAGTY